MILSEIQGEVRERLSEVTADFFTDVEVDRAINEALKRFCHEEKWPWLYTVQKNITVSANNADIELIDDVSVARHFNLGLVPADNSKMVTPKRQDVAAGFRLRARYWGSKAEPKFYYVSRTITNSYDDVVGAPTPDEWAPASIITLCPTPDKAYTAEVYYLREPAKLTTSTQEPDMPDAYQEAIIARATGKLFLKEPNLGYKAQEQFNIYNDILDMARKDLKALALDEVVAWGQEEPEFRIPLEFYNEPQIPRHLGQ